MMQSERLLTDRGAYLSFLEVSPTCPSPPTDSQPNCALSLSGTPLSGTTRTEFLITGRDPRLRADACFFLSPSVFFLTFRG